MTEAQGPHRDPRRRRRITWLIVLGLVVISAPPRLIGLGELSFYFDEDLTALAARSVAEGQEARMPSGMEYRRALPYTWIVAASARLVGTDAEGPYRLPGAILGILTVPVLYLVGRYWVGTVPALLASALLGLSEWHLVFTRAARMYGPFLLAYVVTAYLLWRWVVEGERRHLLLGVLAFSVTATLHLIGVFAVQFAVLPFLLGGPVQVALGTALAAALALGAAGWAFNELWVTAPFRAFRTPDASVVASRLPELGALAPQVTPTAVLAGISGLLMAGVGAWCAWRCYRPVHAGGSREGEAFRRLVVRVLIVAAFAAFGAGLLHAAAFSGTVALVLMRGRWRWLLRGTMGRALLSAVAVGLAWMVVRMVREGWVEGIKASLRMPFPYGGFLTFQFPLLVALFLGVLLVVTFTARGAPSVRGMILAVLVPLLAVGLVSAWGGTRYVLHVYPFLLLTVGWGVWKAASVWADRAGPSTRRPGVVAAVLVVLTLAGVVGGHGLPATLDTVLRRHGEPQNRYAGILPFRPDHALPGRFVRANRAPGDRVVAEDPLQQAWYAGRIDGWLRSPADARRFVFRAPDGTVRDIYTGSELLADAEALDRMTGDPSIRVWLITSGETVFDRDYYLSPTQRAWLRDVESTLEPVAVGRDGVTSVYCLHCDEGGGDQGVSSP